VGVSGTCHAGVSFTTPGANGTTTATPSVRAVGARFCSTSSGGGAGCCASAVAAAASIAAAARIRAGALYPASHDRAPLAVLVARRLVRHMRRDHRRRTGAGEGAAGAGTGIGPANGAVHAGPRRGGRARA